MTRQTRRKGIDPLYARIREILESARSNVARSVNTTQVIANWLIGREILEEEQRGRGRAEYGDRLLAGLSQKLGRLRGGLRRHAKSRRSPAKRRERATPRAGSENSDRA